ncbi:MAG: hypothetical protein WC449_05815 [Candidatus Paceibacterota bacterium]
MISDKTLKQELDSILKRRKIKKAERDIHIDAALTTSYISRDEILDIQEGITREYEQEQSALKHIPSEFKEQCDFVMWFKSAYPGVMIMSIRNHGSRTPRERQEQIMEGLQPGAADLFIPAWAMWIEMKRVKGGVQSYEQKAFERYVTEQDYEYFVCNGFSEAKNICLDYCKL